MLLSCAQMSNLNVFILSRKQLIRKEANIIEMLVFAIVNGNILDHLVTWYFHWDEPLNMC